MGPDFATNVGSAIRAMEQTIIPAVDPANGMAQEQAYLVLYHLRLFAAQHAHLLDFRLQEIRDFAALTRSLLDRAREKGVDLGDSAEAAEAALSSGFETLRLPVYAELAGAAVRLREAADLLTSKLLDQGGTALLEELGLVEAVYATTRRDSARDRSWVKALGMDPRPDEIAPLGEVLAS